MFILNSVFAIIIEIQGKGQCKIWQFFFPTTLEMYLFVPRVETSASYFVSILSVPMKVQLQEMFLRWWLTNKRVILLYGYLSFVFVFVTFSCTILLLLPSVSCHFVVNVTIFFDILGSFSQALTCLYICSHILRHKFVTLEPGE